MNSRARAVAATQHGLITRPQAHRAGIDDQEIQRLVRTHVWQRVARGVYAENSVVESAKTHAQRRCLIDAAMSLRISAPHVWSHHSAAHLAGIAVLNEPQPLTHVTRPGIVGSHNRRAVKHHRAPHLADQVIELEGVRLLDPARTALDITREHGYRQGLVATDSALRLGTSPTELARARAMMDCWPGSTVMDHVLADASADADSVGETLARILVESLGFGRPLLQLGLTADGRTVWCDLCLGRHVFEFDGKVKYQRIDEGGFSSGDPAETLWFEKTRQDFITGFKMGVSRIVWSDCVGPGVDAARRRLAREYRDTCARFGTDTTDLSAYRPRGPRPLPRQTRVSFAA